MPEMGCTDTDAYAFLYTDGDTPTCEGLRPNNDGANTVATQMNDPDTNEITGVALYFISQDYLLNVNITCDASVETFDPSLTTATSDGTNIFVQTTHKTGCPTISLNLIQQFFTEYSYLWGAVLIVLGLIFCFAGNKLINTIIFITGAVISFAALAYCTFTILEKADKNPSDTVQWVIIAGCGVIGIILGLALKRARRLGIAALAAWGGVTVGLILSTTLLIESPYAKYGLMVVFALILAYVAFKVEKIVIIAITGVLGAYMTVRGISLYAGGFPDEMLLQEEIKQGAITWEDFPKSFYAYLAGIVVCAIVGILF